MDKCSGQLLVSHHRWLCPGDQQSTLQPMTCASKPVRVPDYVNKSSSLGKG